MTIQETLVRLDKVNVTLDKVREKTINTSKVLKANEMRITNNVLELDKSVEFHTVWKDKAIISIIVFKKSGSRYANYHIVNFKQYLICLVGSFSVSFGGGYRIVKSSECVSIPSG